MAHHSDAFSPEVVQAVVRHLNEDHAADMVAIVRVVGARPEAQTVTVLGAGPDGLEVAVDGSPEALCLRWDEPVRQRADIRRAVVAWYEKARAATSEP